MKKFIYILVIAVLSIGNVWGQSIRNAAHFETELNDGLQEVHVFKHNSGNLMVLRKSEKAADGDFTYVFTKYNSKLEEDKTAEIQLSKKLILLTKCENGQFLHLLFIKGFSSSEFILCNYDILSNKVNILESNMPDDFRFDRYALYNSSSRRTQIFGNNLLLEGRLAKEPTIVSLDLKTAKYETTAVSVDGVKPGKIYVGSFMPLQGTNEFACMVGVKKSFFSRKVDQSVFIYNDKLELLRSISIDDNPQFTTSIVTGAKVGTDKYVFCGMFTNKIIPQGIYIVNINGSKIEKSTLVGYGKMQNFLTRYSEKYASKMLKKKEKLESKGKEMMINNHITIHPLIVLNENEFILLGELYWPMYHTETYGTGNNMRTREVFDGNQYTDGLCVKFNKDGSVIWDHMLDIYSSYWPMMEYQFITEKVNEKSVSFFLPQKGKIAIQELSFDGQIKDEKTYTIPKETESNETVKENTSFVEYWYDNYFIEYGNQYLKEKNSGLFGRRRSIYYLNRLAY